MPEVICSRLEIKWALHKSSHNWLFEIVSVLFFKSFSVTVVIKNNS